MFNPFAAGSNIFILGPLGSVQLATEAKLSTNLNVTKWVEKYQRSRETVSQTDFEVRTLSQIWAILFTDMGQTLTFANLSVLFYLFCKM